MVLGNEALCCSASNVWLRCEPSRATTPPLTVCTRRRSPSVSTRRCPLTPGSARPRLLVGSVTWPGRGHCSTPRAAITEAWTTPPARPVSWLAWPGGRSAWAKPATPWPLLRRPPSRLGASGDSAVQLLAGTAVAAVKAVTDPTQYNNETFVGLARQRAKGLSYHSHISFQDEPDVAALAARLVLPAR